MIGFFLRRPVTLSMFLVACLLFGVLALVRMDLGFAPDLGQPGLSILVRYPGTGSAKIDRLITKPIEEALARVPKISRLHSVSSAGKSKVHVFFPYGTDLDLASMDILDALAPLDATLPRDVEKPVLLRFNPGDAPVFSVALQGKNLPAVRRFAEKRLQPAFERIKGISEVIVAGGEMREVLVEVDRYRATARKVSLLSIVRSLQLANAQVPGGVLPGLSRDLLTRTSGRFNTLEDMHLVRVGGEEQVVFLSDLARISRAAKPRENQALADGKQQVALYVKKGGKASLLGITARLRRVLERTPLPKGIKARVAYDGSRLLLKGINNLALAGLSAALIAALVLFLFLRKISLTAVVACSIPLSVSITFTLIHVLGIRMDVMTLTGLAVGVGMMVDNGVVVLESISSTARRVSDPHAAALQGARRVAVAVFASTITTACVFLPVLFLSPRMRLLFGNMAAAITLSLFASLVIALAAVPVMVSRLPVAPGSSPVGGTGRSDSKRSAVRAHLAAALTARLEALWDRPRRPLIILAICCLLIVCLVPSMGREVFSALDGESLFVYVEFPSGTNLDHTARVAADVGRILRCFPFIKETSTRIEKGHAVITAKLKQGDGVPDQAHILGRMGARFRTYRKAFVHITRAGGGQGTAGRSITIDVVGNNLHLVQTWARRGAARVAPLPGVRETVLRFKEGAPELLVQIDQKKSALLGISSRDLGLEVRSALFGPIATKYIEAGKEIDVRVRFRGGNRIAPARLGELPITVGRDRTVPLSSLAEFRRTRSGNRIYRKDGKLVASFTARYEGVDLGTMLQRIKRVLSPLSPPPGIRFEAGQEAEALNQSSAAGFFAVGLAVLLIYIVLAATYESFTIPFVILLSIPAALAGAVLVLFLTGTPFSVPVYLGLIMLAGLIVNSAILLVDDTLHQVRSGTPVPSAVRQAVQHRFRPMLITTLTTVLGMLPILLWGGKGLAVSSPLALTVIAGLCTATPLLLFLVPVLFVGVVKETD